MNNNHISSSLSAQQQETFSTFIASLNQEQLIWVSGYLAGFSAQNSTAQTQATLPEPQATKELTILYGSRTGNGEGLAKKAQHLAQEKGLAVQLKNMLDYKVRDISKEKNLLIIVSTHGEGEAPFDAQELYEFLYSKRAPKLETLHYAVLALGDSSYFHFCKTGKDFDEQLETLGAKRLVSRVCCDVDFEETANQWLLSTLDAFAGIASASFPKYRLDVSKINSSTPSHNKKNPFQALVLDKINLHGKASDRQTIHLELNVEDAKLSFEPGDSAGIMPLNTKELIEELLHTTALNGQKELELNGKTITLYEALHREFEISKITPDVIERYLALYFHAQLSDLFNDKDKLKGYIQGRDIVDLFQDFPAALKEEDLPKLLRKLQPRYYSISSSPQAYPGELHLTVGVVNYENAGRVKHGACSTYLSEVSVENEQVPIFIESNPNFRLPKNDETPIIMVGAGTGIAPYRAFIQQRELAEKAGKSWLFFGNRNFETEFLYQTEWQQLLKSGALTKMDVAFSRDKEKKEYVQDRLLEHSAEIYQWLEEGAHFYVCGDMKNMAGDVQNTLLHIVETQGAMSADDARDYLNHLQKEKKMQLDVY